MFYPLFLSNYIYIYISLTSTPLVADSLFIVCSLTLAMKHLELSSIGSIFQTNFPPLLII